MESNNFNNELTALPEPEGENKSTVDERQAKQKAELIAQFRKTPIVQLACERVGIGRTTYYRWRKEDSKFSQDADEAIHDGSFLVNDLAESQLLTCIRDKELGAITFWLKHHHPKYSAKLEVTGKIKHEDGALTPEQEALIKQALKLAGLEESEDNAGPTENRTV